MVSNVVRRRGRWCAVGVDERAGDGQLLDGAAVVSRRSNSVWSGLDGLPDTQAGDHPYETTVSYFLNEEAGSQTPRSGAVEYLPVKKQ